jgi:hypothetical protein
VQGYCRQGFVSSVEQISWKPVCAAVRAEEQRERVVAESTRTGQTVPRSVGIFVRAPGAERAAAAESARANTVSRKEVLEAARTTPLIAPSTPDGRDTLSGS